MALDALLLCVKGYLVLTAVQVFIAGAILGKLLFQEAVNAYYPIANLSWASAALNTGMCILMIALDQLAYQTTVKPNSMNTSARRSTFISVKKGFYLMYAIWMFFLLIHLGIRLKFESFPIWDAGIADAAARFFHFITFCYIEEGVRRPLEAVYG